MSLKSPAPASRTAALRLSDAEVIGRFIAAEDRSPRARRALEQFAEELGERALLSATHEDLEAWWDRRVRTTDDPDDDRRWSEATGRRKRAYVETFFAWASERGLADHLRRAEDGHPGPSPASADLIRRFLNFHRQTFTADTASAYRGDLEQFGSWLGDRNLTEARLDDVTSWFNAHTRTGPADERPWSRVTARRKLAALRTFYGWAETHGLVDAVPLEGYAIDAPDTDTVPVRLTPEQVDRFFEHLERKIALSDPERSRLLALDLAIFRMCYNWALRISEAVNVLMEDVRRAPNGGREIRIRKKGNKVRAYPLTGAVADAHRRWIAVRGTIRVVAGHEGYLFVHPTHGRHVTRKRSWERFRQLGAEIGLDDELEQDETLHPHLLRHAMGYRMADEHGLQAAQSVLDHANIRTTNTYVRDDDRARRKALRKAAEK